MQSIQYYAWEVLKSIAYPISLLKLIPLGVPVDYTPDTISYYVLEHLLTAHTLHFLWLAYYRKISALTAKAAQLYTQRQNIIILPLSLYNHPKHIHNNFDIFHGIIFLI